MRPGRVAQENSSSSNPIRTFVAIELPDPVKQVLLQTQKVLRRDHESTVRWVNPEGIHLTLKFLGNVPFTLISSLEGALQQATSPFSAFKLSLAETGVFPNLHAPRVVWVGVAGDLDVLTNLHNSIEKALVPMGFTPEGRPFSPHLTLGRVRQEASTSERRALGEVARTLALPSNAGFTVDAVNLMRSELRLGGAIYTCLASFPLAGLVQDTPLV